MTDKITHDGRSGSWKIVCAPSCSGPGPPSSLSLFAPSGGRRRPRARPPRRFGIAGENRTLGEPLAVDEPAVLDDVDDATVACDVGEGITVEDDEVGPLSHLEGADLVVAPIRLRDVAGRAEQGVHPGHAPLERGLEPQEVHLAKQT